MVFSQALIRQVESTLIFWIASNRPEVEIRNKLDISFSIKGQEIFPEEITPSLDEAVTKTNGSFW